MLQIPYCLMLLGLKNFELENKYDNFKSFLRQAWPFSFKRTVTMMVSIPTSEHSKERTGCCYSRVTVKGRQGFLLQFL